MRVSKTPRRGSGDEEVHGLVGEYRDLGIEQRHVDVGTFTSRGTAIKRRENADGRIDARENICERDADFCGSPSGDPVRSIMPPMPCTMKS